MSLAPIDWIIIGVYLVGCIIAGVWMKRYVRGVTDFAVSTATSNPHDPATNPTGVEEASLVRLSMGTTMKLQDKGVTTWPYRVDRITLRPRN